MSNKTISAAAPVDLNYAMNLAGMEGQVVRHIFISLEPDSPLATSSHSQNAVGASASRTLRATLDYVPGRKNTCRLFLSSPQNSIPADTSHVTLLPVPPETRSIILTIVGEANPSACLAPVGVNYGSIPRDKIDAAPRTVTLRGANKDALLTAAAAKPPFQLAIAPDKKSLSVVLPKTAQPGLYVQNARIQTTDPEVPEMPVYLYAHVLGDLEILPNAIEISRAQPRASAVLMLRPSRETAPGFRVESASLVPVLGDVRVRSFPDGSWRVHLAGIPTADVLPRSFLLLKTTSAISPEIKIPIIIKD